MGILVLKGSIPGHNGARGLVRIVKLMSATVVKLIDFPKGSDINPDKLYLYW